MTGDLDLDAYFARIGWGGGTAPTLETLTGLLHAHTGAIPFENLDVLLRRPVRLDLEGLQDKLVQRRRGGYCFEHATLFAALLRRLGFSLATHAARVVVARPKEESPRGHMFLTVNLDGERYVTDPGFAAYTARRPLPLRAGHPDGNDAHILTQEDGRWTLHARRDGALVVAVAGVRKGRVGQREDVAAVADAVAVRELRAHGHAQACRAGTDLDELHAHALRRAVVRPQDLGAALGNLLRRQCRHHFPMKCGGRFSMKAVTPSR